VDIPASLYQPINHGAVVLKTASEPQAAQEFLDFLTGPKGQEILERAGLGAPRK
jgi:ABC-type molybdate transport system substrate-binding protein